MQAHPQSNPAARLQSTSPSTPHPAPTATQPCSRVLKVGTASPLTDSPASLVDTAGLAHDAGNLLAALGLYCDLLSAPGVLRPEHCHYATELSLISNRSSALIRRLIASCNSTPTQRSTPDLAFTLRSLTPVLQQIAASAANVSITCPVTLPPLDVAPETIERIVVNLVRNAAQAIRSQRRSTILPLSPPRSDIRIALAIVTGRLQLTVEDTGPGMPPATVAAFLQPVPLPSGATNGLGHRIVHELVHSSGGQLSIRVRPGTGTLLRIKWPLPKTSLSEHRRFDIPATLANPATFSNKTSLKGPATC